MQGQTIKTGRDLTEKWKYISKIGNNGKVKAQWYQSEGCDGPSIVGAQRYQNVESS